MWARERLLRKLAETVNSINWFKTKMALVFNKIASTHQQPLFCDSALTSLSGACVVVPENIYSGKKSSIWL